VNISSLHSICPHRLLGDTIHKVSMWRTEFVCGAAALMYKFKWHCSVPVNQ